MRYELQWDRGPSAVIDVQQRDDAFLLRYDSPFRLTLRPMLESPGSPYDLQEPVARLHYRGHPNRGLRVLELEGDETPAYDAELTVEGKPVGRVTSAVSADGEC